MNPEPSPESAADNLPSLHRRRPRYAGKHPRRFAEKYKELAPAQHPETVVQVEAAGKTVAGTHRPIMVEEIPAVLRPRPGEVAVDGTLGYGGHAQEVLARIGPGGRLVGLDADPVELPKTVRRLRALGFGPELFSAHLGNFAGMPRVLADAGLAGADMILADLGVSSMQIDDPARGFSVKLDGPLDMRMNPRHGRPASVWLEKVGAAELARVLTENADEPQAEHLAARLAGRSFGRTGKLAAAIRAALPGVAEEERDRAVRRVFQAVRIAVNDELGALEMWLRLLPFSLKPGGRVAVLTFHSGEDRRVKKAFAAGRAAGVYVEISAEVTRATPAECFANPRAKSAKLRWAVRAGGGLNDICEG